MELNEFFAGKPFMDVHDDENRGNFIAFSQGAKDRKLQNQALVAFEVSFHGSTKDALLQGQPRQTGFFELALRNRNMQVRFI